MGVSENSVPLHPMVLLIIIPIKWLLNYGNIPNIFRQTHIVDGILGDFQAITGGFFTQPFHLLQGKSAESSRCPDGESQHGATFVLWDQHPYAPCMEYLPTFTP